jgi:hypothetical protein
VLFESISNHRKDACPSVSIDDKDADDKLVETWLTQCTKQAKHHCNDIENLLGKSTHPLAPTDGVQVTSDRVVLQLESDSRDQKGTLSRFLSKIENITKTANETIAKMDTWQVETKSSVTSEPPATANNPTSLHQPEGDTTVTDGNQWKQLFRKQLDRIVDIYNKAKDLVHGPTNHGVTQPIPINTNIQPDNKVTKAAPAGPLDRANSVDSIKKANLVNSPYSVDPVEQKSIDAKHHPVSTFKSKFAEMDIKWMDQSMDSPDESIVDGNINTYMKLIDQSTLHTLVQNDELQPFLPLLTRYNQQQREVTANFINWPTIQSFTDMAVEFIKEHHDSKDQLSAKLVQILSIFPKPKHYRSNPSFQVAAPELSSLGIERRYFVFYHSLRQWLDDNHQNGAVTGTGVITGEN